MKKSNSIRICLAVVMPLLLCGLVYATATDTTFSGPVGRLTGWLEGSMGKLFSIGALAVGLGVGIVQQSVMSVAVGTGIALAASAGPTVLNTIFLVAL